MAKNKVYRTSDQIPTIGVDMTTISRFDPADEKLINRILSEKEKEDLSSAVNKAQFLAVRWASKEALYKAIATSFKGKRIEFSMNEITIDHDKNNAPYFMGPYWIQGCSLSITHEGDTVVATVMYSPLW